MNILNNGIRMSFQNFRHMKANTKKEKSIFRTILAAMLLVLGIEILLLVAALGISHVSTQLNQNAVDILEKQVDNRQSYLENLLTANEELSSLAERINNTAQELVDSGQIRIGDIEKNKEDYLLLMKSISERMLNNMRRKSVPESMWRLIRKTWIREVRKIQFQHYIFGIWIRIRCRRRKIRIF